MLIKEALSVANSKNSVCSMALLVTSEEPVSVDIPFYTNTEKRNDLLVESSEKMKILCVLPHFGNNVLVQCCLVVGFPKYQSVTAVDSNRIESNESKKKDIFISIIFFVFIF